MLKTFPYSPIALKALEDKENKFRPEIGEENNCTDIRSKRLEQVVR